jgi:hypothetical protein
MVLVRVAADVMAYALPFKLLIKAISKREVDSHSLQLHFQADPITCRMSALADRPRILLRVGTGFAAMSLAACGLTRTAGMFAFFYLCHKRSSEPNSPFS